MTEPRIEQRTDPTDAVTGLISRGISLPHHLVRAPDPATPLRSRSRSADWVRRRLLAVADATAITLALLLTLYWTAGRASDLEHLLYGVATVPAWLVLFKAYGLYDRDTKRVSHTTIDDLPWIFHAAAIGSIGMWIYFEALPVEKLVFSNVLLFAVGTMVFTLAFRSAVRRLGRRLVGSDRVLLVGTGPSTELLIRKMREHPEYGLTPIGLLTDDTANGNGNGRERAPERGRFERAAVATLGSPDEFPRVIEDHDVDRIVLSHEGLTEEDLADVLRASRKASVKVSILPQMSDLLGPSVELDSVEGVTVLGVNPPALSRSSRFLKRTVDVLGAATILIVLAPLLAAIAIAIKATSRGPVLFRQERIGRGGRRFKLVKFRTMDPDAETKVDELLAQSLDPDWLHLDDDPRITRIGQLLRSTSLDELPQLWNVVVGEMSLVGPRPLQQRDDENVFGWGRSRLDLTPGITGYWQVLGRTRIPFQEMLKLDYLYVANWSLWGDVRLIAHTLPVVLTRRGAN